MVDKVSREVSQMELAKAKKVAGEIHSYFLENHGETNIFILATALFLLQLDLKKQFGVEIGRQGATAKPPIIGHDANGSPVVEEQ